jgi:hypothetical protein
VHSVRGVVAHADAHAPKMRHANPAALLAELSYGQVAMTRLSGEFGVVTAEHHAHLGGSTVYPMFTRPLSMPAF